jgi:predicted dehydrogenase
MKVIQVGMGGMGNAWLRAVQASPVVEYAGFVEVSPEMAATQVGKYGLDGSKVFRTLSEALAAVNADGVINVTPPQFHKEISITALEAGLPVLSEKPLADTREAALAIVEKAEATGVLHMVAQNRRYMVGPQTLKHALTSPDMGADMGAIGSASVEFFRGPHFGGFREEMAYPLIIDMSIHHFDLMRYLLDGDPVNVFGRSWNPPWSWYKGDASAAVVIEFGGGKFVDYSASWCSQASEQSWNGEWRIECANGVVLMQHEEVFTQRIGEEAVEVAPVVLPLEAQGYLLQEFYTAVTTGAPPVTTCRDNIKSLSIVFDVIQSFETGQVVRSAA